MSRYTASGSGSSRSTRSGTSRNYTTSSSNGDRDTYRSSQYTNGSSLYNNSNTSPPKGRADSHISSNSGGNYQYLKEGWFKDVRAAPEAVGLNYSSVGGTSASFDSSRLPAAYAATGLSSSAYSANVPLAFNTASSVMPKTYARAEDYYRGGAMTGFAGFGTAASYETAGGLASHASAQYDHGHGRRDESWAHSALDFGGAGGGRSSGGGEDVRRAAADYGGRAVDYGRTAPVDYARPERAERRDDYSRDRRRGPSPARGVVDYRTERGRERTDSRSGRGGVRDERREDRGGGVRRREERVMRGGGGAGEYRHDERHEEKRAPLPPPLAPSRYDDRGYPEPRRDRRADAQSRREIAEDRATAASLSQFEEKERALAKQLEQIRRELDDLSRRESRSSTSHRAPTHRRSPPPPPSYRRAGEGGPLPPSRRGLGVSPRYASSSVAYYSTRGGGGRGRMAPPVSSRRYESNVLPSLLDANFLPPRAGARIAPEITTASWRRMRAAGIDPSWANTHIAPAAPRRGALGAPLARFASGGRRLLPLMSSGRVVRRDARREAVVTRRTRGGAANASPRKERRAAAAAEVSPRRPRRREEKKKEAEEEGMAEIIEAMSDDEEEKSATRSRQVKERQQAVLAIVDKEAVHESTLKILESKAAPQEQEKRDVDANKETKAKESGSGVSGAGKEDEDWNIELVDLFQDDTSALAELKAEVAARYLSTENVGVDEFEEDGEEAEGGSKLSIVESNEALAEEEIKKEEVEDEGRVEEQSEENGVAASTSEEAIKGIVEEMIEETTNGAQQEEAEKMDETAAENVEQEPEQQAVEAQLVRVAQMSQRWEDLRKRARNLENDVDVKLTQLNKMTTPSRPADPSPSGEAAAPPTRQQHFDRLCESIDRVLAQLAELNDEMSTLVEGASGAGWASNPAVTHTVRRHREILRDYGSEFARARENIRGQLQREYLLSGAGSGSSSPDGSILNNRVRASDLYYKEQDHINSCDRLIDDQISIAVSTKENLAKQGMSMRGISRRMQTLAKKYPMVGSIMTKIQNKKRRDTMILAGVISACLIFTFFYLSH